MTPFQISRATSLSALAVALALLAGNAAALCAGGNENTAVPATTPASAFIDHGDGTVTHDATGLMWLRCSEGQAWDGTTCSGTPGALAWADALKAGDLAVAATYSDWRLPNLKELESIVEARCWAPAIEAGTFPATGGTYWTSSPYAGDGVSSLVVDFTAGTTNILSRTGTAAVRLVRAGR